MNGFHGVRAKAVRSAPRQRDVAATALASWRMSSQTGGKVKPFVARVIDLSDGWPMVSGPIT
jgi:hypothetical protein